jgi:hypothetical protein
MDSVRHFEGSKYIGNVFGNGDAAEKICDVLKEEK